MVFGMKPERSSGKLMAASSAPEGRRSGRRWKNDLKMFLGVPDQEDSDIKEGLATALMFEDRWQGCALPAGTSASRCCPEPRCGRNYVNDVMELNVGKFIVSATMSM
eukprot:681739-Heterocapsa_arctica.AAC.1